MSILEINKYLLFKFADYVICFTLFTWMSTVTLKKVNMCDLMNSVLMKHCTYLWFLVYIDCRSCKLSVMSAESWANSYSKKLMCCSEKQVSSNKISCQKNRQERIRFDHEIDTHQILWKVKLKRCKSFS